jgi:hypothetical protein
VGPRAGLDGCGKSRPQLVQLVASSYIATCLLRYPRSRLVCVEDSLIWGARHERIFVNFTVQLEKYLIVYLSFCNRAIYSA